MKALLLYIILLLFAINSSGQSRNELEAEKKKTINDINYTNKLIRKNVKVRKNTYNQLLLINKKLELRNELISTIKQELLNIDKQIIENQKIIFLLKSDMEKIKKEYSLLIYYAYKYRKPYEVLLFVFSADDLNQAYRRVRYIKELSEFRVKQAELIQITEKDIYKKIEILEIEKARRKELVFEKNEEKDNLNIEENRKKVIIRKLKSKEKELKEKLTKQQNINSKINKKIRDFIEEEARKAAKLSKGKELMILTPEEKIISSEFSKNKLRLPWPTERGIITQKLGEQNHPILKGIKIRNDGIDISTTENSIVRVIFKGEVSRIFAISGANKSVIIRHGNYLSVYSNLKEVIVKVGEKVDTKQTIGTVYFDVNDPSKSTLKFQIWKENTKLNPEQWIVKGK